MPEHQRSDKMLKMNKMLRQHTDPHDMSESACNSYRIITSVRSVSEHMENIGGAVKAPARDLNA